jgi:hypothetical protein
VSAGGGGRERAGSMTRWPTREAAAAAAADGWSGTQGRVEEPAAAQS